MPRMKKDGLLVQLDNLVREHPDFEVLCEPTLCDYCFRYIPNGLVERREEPEVQELLDRLNEEIVGAVQRDGVALLTMTRVARRIAIRISIGSRRTLKEDIDATFDAIAHWGRLLSKKLSVRYETDLETKTC